MDKVFFKNLFRLIQDYKNKLLFLVVLSVFQEMVRFVPNIVLAVVVDTLGNFDADAVKTLIVAFGCLVIASVCILLLTNYFIKVLNTIVFKIEADLLLKCSQKMLRLSIGYHENSNTGAQFHRIQKGALKLNRLVFEFIYNYTPTLLQFFFTIVILFYTHWMFGVIFLVSAVPYFSIIYDYSLKVQPYRRLYHGTLHTIVGEMSEKVFNVRTVQDSVAEVRELKKQSNMFQDYFGFMKTRIDMLASVAIRSDGILNVVRILLIITALFLVWKKVITPGELVLVITLFEKLNSNMVKMRHLYDEYADNVTSVQEVIEILEQPEDIQSNSRARKVKKIRGDIEFKNVLFAYKKDQPKILDNFSFHIAPKQTVAMIGRSGAGKSTLVKLLYRHFDIQDGEILIDGEDIRKYDVYSLRKRLATVPQDIEVFNTTVRDNIAFADMHASQKDIEKAAKLAFAHDFIKGFPSGYDTLVGEKGVKLSGGQKQRIGIARALLMKPDILIFDEATSSLDTESEQLIQKALQGILKKQTVIIIAHRLSTIEKADKILVIENGRVVEEGAPKDLLNTKGGVYKRMRELQRLGEIV